MSDLISNAGLLVRLSSYRPREGRNSLEDFVTEAFAWLLQANDDFQSAFLQLIAEKLAENGKQLPLSTGSSSEEQAEWLTQESYKNSRFDMVAKLNDAVLIFEHKVHAAAYSGQIKKYIEHGKEYQTEKPTYVLMITANSTQFISHADACLRWEDVYRLIEDFIKLPNVDSLIEQNLNDFNQLLRYHGLAPAAPVSHQAIQVYPLVSNFITSLKDMFVRLQLKDWSFFEGFSVSEKLEDRYGRLGLCFVNESTNQWNPAFILAVVLDGSDLRVSHRLTQELKLHLILSIGNEHHKTYPSLNAYSNFKKQLQKISDPEGWQLFDQLEYAGGKANKYHPLHMEYPLLDLLQGTSTSEEQVEKVYQKTQKLINDIQKTAELKDLTNQLVN